MHLHERYRTVSPYIVTNIIGGTLFCYKTINAKRHKNSSSPSVCFSFSNTFQIFILTRLKYNEGYKSLFHTLSFQQNIYQSRVKHFFFSSSSCHRHYMTYCFERNETSPPFYVWYCKWNLISSTILYRIT